MGRPRKLKRQLTIADIHGGLKALKQVLIKCNYDKLNDQLIFTGDYVDGWGESAQVIDFLIELQKEATHKPIFILGNHDEEFMYWMESKYHAWGWGQGAKATIESYAKLLGLTIFMKPYKSEYGISYRLKGITPEDIPQSHKDFYKGLQRFYFDTKNKRVFVHGGFNRHQPLAMQQIPQIYYWDRDLLSAAVACQLSRNMTLRFKDDIEEVYVGHTTTIQWGVPTPIIVDKVIANDTGAGFDGKLTVLDVNTKEYWQSDLLPDLYPLEKGRT